MSTARKTARVSLMPPLLTGAILFVEAVAEAAPELVGDGVAPVVLGLGADLVDGAAQVPARVGDLRGARRRRERAQRLARVVDGVLLRLDLVADLVARVLADLPDRGANVGQRRGGRLRR